MVPTKLYESLFIMHKCNSTINMLWDLTKDNHDKSIDARNYSALFTNYLIMESISFLDEFEGKSYSSIEVEYQLRMKDVRKLTSPIMKRIKKWKDLQQFRNNIIAHPWRHKGQFVIPHEKFYNIPSNWFEVSVLVNLMNYIWSLIKAEFEQEFNAVFPYIESLAPMESSAYLQEIMSDYDGKYNLDHLQMADEVNNICLELNKPYRIKVWQYSLPNKE